LSSPACKDYSCRFERFEFIWDIFFGHYVLTGYYPRVNFAISIKKNLAAMKTIYSKGRLATALKDGLAAAAIVVALVGWLTPHLLRPCPQKLYVSPQGRNWQAGTRQHPLASVGRAIELAQPKTTIAILPGFYRERICFRRSGRPKTPLVIQAVEPGTVILSGRAPNHMIEALVWHKKGGGIYETSVSWAVYAVLANGDRLLHCRNESSFFLFTGRPGAYGAFFQKNSRLLLRLRNGSHPGNAKLAFNGPVPERLANGLWRAANLWIEGSHIRLQGIRLELGAGSGICLFKSQNIGIQECLFTGADFGINLVRAAAGATDLTVKNCAGLNYPAGDWQPQWLSWEECYANQRYRAFIAAVGDGVIIKNNLIVGANDGLEISTPYASSPKGADIAENLIAHCNDDAIEFDGFAENMNFYHNLIYNCRVSLGVSPVLRGPVTIWQNMFLNPANRINAGQIKLLSPWRHRSPPLNGFIRNIEIFGNIFVGNWLGWWHADWPVIDVHIHHNLFAIQRHMTPMWPNGVHEHANRYIQLSLMDYPNPGTDKQWLTGIKTPNRPTGSQRRLTAAEQKMLPPIWPFSRPGPAWMKWDEYPDTARLLDDIDSGILTP
jgi:hypothetical protein